MNFLELKKNIVQNNIYHCYNVFGDDDFLVKSSCDMLFNYLTDKNELSKVMLSTENLTAESLNNILNTSSFLGGKKLVILSDFDSIKNKDLLRCILEYSISPLDSTILCVVSQQKIIDEKKVNELNVSQKNFSFIDCSRIEQNMLFAWIDSRLRETKCSMTDDAKNKLIDFTNGYLSHISIELDKLIAFADGKQITSTDVENMVTKELEFSIYELTENLGKKNYQKSFEILNLMMSDKKVSLSVFALIQNYFRRMFFSAITSGTNAQIAQQLGVKEYAIKKAKESAKYFSKIKLKQIVELCNDLDLKIKTSQLEYSKAVTLLVMSILEK